MVATVQLGSPTLKRAKRRTADVLAELADLGRDQLLDGLRLLLDERLLEQADLLVELAHLAFEHLLDHCWRACRSRPPVRDRFPSRARCRRRSRLRCGCSAGRPRRCAWRCRAAAPGSLPCGRRSRYSQLSFDEHADLSAGVDVGADRAFIGGARAFFAADAMPRLRRTTNACFHVALRLLQRLRQSPMGAPDFSRSSLTSFASIFSVSQQTLFMFPYTSCTA